MVAENSTPDKQIIACAAKTSFALCMEGIRGRRVERPQAHVQLTKRCPILSEMKKGGPLSV